MNRKWIQAGFGIPSAPDLNRSVLLSNSNQPGTYRQDMNYRNGKAFVWPRALPDSHDCEGMGPPT